MRRVVIECVMSDIVKRSVSDVSEQIGGSIDRIESFEVLNFLTITPEEFAMIGRVRFKDPNTQFDDVFTTGVQVLEQEEEGTYVCFFKGKTGPGFPGIARGLPEGYPCLPIEIRDGRVKVTFLGSAKAVREFLEAFENVGLRYKLLLLTNDRFPPNSPLGRLTEKQRKVIVTAFNLGYYDMPKKIESKELAKRLNIREPTLVRHRRKAERRLLAELLREY
jgi:hypothetical protein